jgi:hypothetical protein
LIVVPEPKNYNCVTNSVISYVPLKLVLFYHQFKKPIVEWVKTQNHNHNQKDSPHFQGMENIRIK